MKKKISVNDIRLGMYIDSLCGNWINHPFWKRSFLLDQQKDLDALLVCGTKELYIDTDRGLDVAAPDEPAAVEVPAAPEEDSKRERNLEPPVVLADEIKRARKIHAQAQLDVTEMFHRACNEDELRLDRALILVDDIRRSTARNPHALLSMTRNRDRGNYLSQHSIAVSALMIMLGRQMEMDHETILSLGLAGLLHDIGYVGLPDEMLNVPGKLSIEEYNVAKDHPKRGWEILKSHRLDNIVQDVCLHHHEQINGEGYPDQLTQDALTVFSRMAAICVAYDMLVADSYHLFRYGVRFQKGISPANAIRQMTMWQEARFDKQIFHAFIKTMGIYPFGTLVKLKSGRVAVVEGQSNKSLTAPIVRVFFSVRVNEPIQQQWVDLSKVQDAIVGVSEPEELEKELGINLKIMSVV